MRYIAIILFLFNVASAQSLFGVVAGDGFDADARRYLDSAGVTDATVRSATSNYFRALKSNGFWNNIRSICPMLGSGETNRRLNAKDLRRNTDSSVRLTFAGTYNFDSSYTGVALRGGRVLFNTTTGTNSFVDGVGGWNPPEDNALILFSCRQTTGFSSYNFINLGENRTNMSIRADGTTVGYNPFQFSAWYDFTANYYGITILNGNGTLSQQNLLQNGTVLQSTYRVDGTGTVYYPYGMQNNTTLNVNLIIIGNGQFTQTQLQTLNTITNTYLTALGRL